ncbi:MAG: nitroreductase family deazaflavin-dependent oxidoreductase [Anaerolineae bacterium]|nr:nitroreductase family deazaflavin-dependent oxidoreductase [Anaerolineae bacterium]
MNLNQFLHKGVRTLLKHTLNPLTRRLARTPYSPFALIQHRGRRSGKQYETPVILGTAADGFVAELTYGPEVDWYKNVIAAGGCTVIWHGKNYVVNKVEPMDTDIGRSAFPLPAQLILRLANRRHFVKMTADRSAIEVSTP